MCKDMPCRITQSFIFHHHHLFFMEENARDWKEYNEELIRRGEVLLDLEFLKTWDRELEEMNKEKIGHPYDYPDSYINFLSVIYYIFGIPYRQLEGFMRALPK